MTPTCATCRYAVPVEESLAAAYRPIPVVRCLAFVVRTQSVVARDRPCHHVPPRYERADRSVD